jgi:hypothetical protein
MPPQSGLSRNHQIATFALAIGVDLKRPVGKRPLADVHRLFHTYSDKALFVEEAVNVIEISARPRLSDDRHVYGREEAKPPTAPFDLPDQIARERCCALLISYHLLF